MEKLLSFILVMSLLLTAGFVEENPIGSGISLIIFVATAISMKKLGYFNKYEEEK